MTNLDVAALLIRVIVGATMIMHGYNHGFGPGGLAGTARWFGGIGLRPPRVHALLSCAMEIAAGAALVLGLLTPLAGASVVGTMLVALVTNHRKNGFFVFKEGYEYVLMIAVICTALGVLGPGTISVDHLLGLDDVLDGAVGALIAGGGGVLGAALLLITSWRPAPAEKG